MRGAVLLFAALLCAGTAHAELWIGFTAFSQRPQTSTPATVERAQSTPLSGLPSLTLDMIELPNDGYSCERAILAAESRHGLPQGMLLSIGLTEAGRGGQVWPWTVNDEGRSHYFETKADAIAHVRRAESLGHNRVDTGCMQINRYWHRDAFDSLDAAFDPALNVDYAARYLLSLYEEAGDWRSAVGMYHSREKVRKANYVRKVVSAKARAEALAMNVRAAADAASDAPLPSISELPKQTGLLPSISAALDTVDVARFAAPSAAPRMIAVSTPPSPEPQTTRRPDAGLWTATLSGPSSGTSLYSARGTRPLFAGKPAPLY